MGLTIMLTGRSESKKLKKKYIGDHMPKNKELGNGYGNDNHML